MCNVRLGGIVWSLGRPCSFVVTIAEMYDEPFEVPSVGMNTETFRDHDGNPIDSNGRWKLSVDTGIELLIRRCGQRCPELHHGRQVPACFTAA